MSLRRALLAALPLALAALTRSAAGATGVDPGALAHCAAITGADERLACYDTLARPKPSPAAAAKPAPASEKSSAHAATAGAAPTSAAAVKAAPATAATSPPAAGTAAAGATAAGTAAGSASSFGLTKHAAPEPGPDYIQAHVTRVDANALGTVRISLDNGQVWTYTDPEALIRVGDAVTIKRGALRSFLLTTPTHHTYKAQRSQ